MKSRQFTLGLMALILSGLLSFKAVAQCCVAPVNLTAQTIYLVHLGTPPPFSIYGNVVVYSWQRVQQAGCTTPIKYKLQWRRVGKPNWNYRILTTKPDATFREFRDTCIIHCCSGTCGREIEWRVQGICSDTNKTPWVHGGTFTTLTAPAVTTSSTSDASSQVNFTVAAYPNPVTGELKLSGNLKAGGPVNVQVINSVGQTVLRQDYNFNPGNFNTGIDVSKLPPGVYLVVVNDKTDRETLNIIKQ